jgi:hypothetical protein
MACNVSPVHELREVTVRSPEEVSHPSKLLISWAAVTGARKRAVRGIQRAI